MLGSLTAFSGGCEPVSRDILILQAIWRSINSFNYENASLLSEIMLQKETYKEDILYMAAYSNYHIGRIRIAHTLLLSGATKRHSKFLMANCCLKLKLYSEGISILKSILKTDLDKGVYNSKKVSSSLPIFTSHF